MKVARTWYAAGLLTAALAALLVAWFVSGWADVRGRQLAERAAPQREADARGSELAHELRGELAQLMSREVERPYFHYQNLMHDPRATGSVGVTPSPLANGPTDKLVRGYFQIADDGTVTTPTINDEVPELSEPKQLAGNQQFRAAVAKTLAGQAPPRPERVAEATAPVVKRTPPRQVPPQQVPPRGQGEDPRVEPQGDATEAAAQVIEIDENSYVQNWNSNSIYQQYRNAPGLQREGNRGPQDSLAPRVDNRASTTTSVPTPADTRSTPRVQNQVAPTTSSDAESTPAEPPPVASDRTSSPRAPVETPTTASSDTASNPSAAPTTPRVRRPRPAVVPEPVAAPKSVTITVAPLEWRTLPFDGRPALVAVREVETPDGAFAQGFVVDPSALTTWIAARAGDTVVELVPGDDSTTEVAPGWHLAASANPRALAEAAESAAHLAASFLLRFILLGVIAALAAGLVVMLVARAERLARERSQFAAAAAHELRTPLAGLQLYGDMIADGLGDPQKTRDYAKRMSEEASRLGRVVSNVLGFSQLERGNLSVDPSVGALDAELRSLAERAEPALDRAGAALALDVAPDLTAKFDRDALARIVGNLLDNAEKYGRAAEDRTIELAARPTADAIEVVVSDHGPGVAEKTRSKLFTPFARGVNADGPAGLGLGLALSQSLARAMGGELDYRPAASGGAAFVLRLPRA